MKKLLKGLLLGVIGLLLASCANEYCRVFGGCNTVNEPPKVSGENIRIYEDTVLDGSKKGKTYHVYGVHLDLNGFTLSGNMDNGVVSVAVVLHQGATVSNGFITRYYNAISIHNDLEHGYLEALKGVTREQAKAIGYDYRAKASSAAKIDGVHVSNMIHSGVYVQAFAVGTVISRSSFEDIGRMAVYLDHGSAEAEIWDSKFEDCGYNHRSGRECIAIDSSERNKIHGNEFYNASLCLITIYTNWGENGIQRVSSDYNEIYNNKFFDSSCGVSVASRMFRDVAGATVKDYAKFNRVYDNQFRDVNLKVEILDSDNVEFGNVSL